MTTRHIITAVPRLMQSLRKRRWPGFAGSPNHPGRTRMKRSTTLATFMLSPLSLTAPTGCGGGSADAKGSPGTPTSSASASPTRTAGPTQQVQQRILTSSDAAGYLVSKPHSEYGLAKSQKDLSVDKSACLPAGYAMNSLPAGSPQASLTRIAAKKEPDGILTYITLSIDAHGQAQAAMTGLSTAAKSCADGFTAKGPDGENPYRTVRPEPSPAGGDEALAFAPGFDDACGHTRTVRTQVFRFGDLVVTYFAIDSQAFLHRTTGNAKIPPPVVKTQNAKLT
ncbi:hypothetical protein [Streptomyces sp. NPDC048665]|uniref:hypothetical protein n=1 Tax=Streptomyces sp. NPDC048665 TaxID=3155490 RepID=UPI003447897E